MSLYYFVCALYSYRITGNLRIALNYFEKFGPFSKINFRNLVT